MDKNFDRKIFEAEVDFDSWGCIPFMVLSSLIFAIGYPILYYAAINFDISRLEGIIYTALVVAILEYFVLKYKKIAKDNYFDIKESPTPTTSCLWGYREKRRIYLKAKRQLLIAETAPFSILFSGLLAILSLITSIPTNKEHLALLRDITPLDYPLYYIFILLVAIFIVVPAMWYYIYHLGADLLDLYLCKYEYNIYEKENNVCIISSTCPVQPLPTIRQYKRHRYPFKKRCIRNIYKFRKKIL